MALGCRAEMSAFTESLGGTESDTFGHYVAILVGKIDPG
jgi:hypothetical protein